MHIVVASHNPVKLESVQQAFALAYPGVAFQVAGVAVPSGVSDQPMSDAETHRGAHNRVMAAREAQPHADYWVGIEGGLEDVAGALHCFAWAVIYGREADREGSARSATFILPEEVARLVRQGLELGDADDVVFGRSNSKQQNGSVGLLTGDRITRTTYYVPAVLLALIPFLNPALSFPR